VNETIGIAGSGAIACGLASAAAQHGANVTLWARSEGSATRAGGDVKAFCERHGGGISERVTVTSDVAALAGASFLVEAVTEDPATKTAVWGSLNGHVGEDTLLATTTSSLSVAQLARASGHPERFVALHVFNPVPKMKLVELCFPREATEATRARAHALCESLGKTAVEVPDVPGFVVNRLLFPYLFDAVRLHERTGLDPEAIDTCMRLGAGHPLGPLALLDLVGLDIAAAIGQAIGSEVPDTVRAKIAAGELGRKAGRGFFAY
jgi:3-hydroxybutyryl-CoA dehydrogenase